MNKKNRIGKELISVLLLIFSIIVLLILVSSYVLHNKETEKLCKDRIARLTSAAASVLDGDYLKELSDSVCSEEYQTLREEALQEEDPSILEDYLKQKDLYADYEYYTAALEQMLETGAADRIFVQNQNDTSSICLLDPGESILSLGQSRDNTQNADAEASETIAGPSVAKSEYGWLCTGSETIADSDGSTAAIVSTELSMNELISRQHRSLFFLILQSIVLLFVAAAAGSFYLRKFLSEPLSSLAGEIKSFGAADDDDLSSQVVEVPALRKDEVGDLYKDVRSMQLGIIRYMNNLKQVTEEKERLGTELDVANRIQAGMLPNTFPAFPDRPEFDIYALMKPAKSVAGDFYDFFLVDDDHLAVVIADVSGKGIPASLFMMMAKLLISNIAQKVSEPHRILELANDRICVNNDENMFVTVWLGILTLSSGHIIASNAGHEYPALQNEDGTFELFHDKHGFVVGGMAGLRYKDYEFDLKKGQTLFLYTDGVPDATTIESELFGTERLIEALNAHPELNPRDLVHYMLRTVDDFDGDVPQFDDITMVALRYNGTEEL